MSVIAVIGDAGLMRDRRAVRSPERQVTRASAPCGRTAATAARGADVLTLSPRAHSKGHAGPRPLPRRIGTAACRPRPQPHPLRFMLVLALVSAACVLVLAGLGAAAGGGGAVPAATTVVLVKPGETLWDIARSHAPAVEPAAVVKRIRELNHLPSAAIDAGEPLVVPDASRSAGE